jgi:hypothetical protein
MPCAAGPARHFLRQHEGLDAQLHTHLLDVVGGDFVQADLRLRQWRAGLARHIEIEEQELLPHLPESARWAARVYRQEHERIVVLADEYGGRLAQVLASPPATEAERRHAALWLIDAAHALRHVLDHHHQREHTALALELPEALQERVWREHGLAQELEHKGGR